MLYNFLKFKIYYFTLKPLCLDSNYTMPWQVITGDLVVGVNFEFEFVSMESIKTTKNNWIHIRGVKKLLLNVRLAHIT